MDDDLIAAHGEVPKLMPYLHLPVQAGSDRILKAMNRRHTAEDYVGAGRAASGPRGPTSRSPATFIVGFPGETDADFEDTLASSATSALPAPSPSNTARGRARPRRSCRIRFRIAWRASGSMPCRR